MQSMIGEKPASLVIAEVCHEASRIYCAALRDESQVRWCDAPEWQKASVLAGVKAILSGEIKTPAQSHAGWMRRKLADGWVEGAVKDPEAKTHPCLVPYDALPAEQRVKDTIFFGLVRTFQAVIEETTNG